MSKNGRMRINMPKVVHETIDGETVVLNLDNGNYYSLIGIGADIWGYIEKGAGVNDIMERLYRDYEGGREEMEREVNTFLSELMKENLTAPDGDHSPDGINSFDAQDDNDDKRQKASFSPPELNKYSDMQDLLLLDPIHEVDDQSGWPNVNENKGWPTRDPDSPFEHE